MIKIRKNVLERFTGKECIKNAISLGVDTASRTGWSIAKVKNKWIELDYGFISVKNVKGHPKKFSIFIDFFLNFLEKESKNKNFNVVVEDAFYGRNANTFKLLSRFGMIVYVISELKHIPRIFLMATSARSRLNLTGTAKKYIIHEQIKTNFGIKIEDEDIVDAIVLALNGVLREKKGLDI